MSVTLSNGGSEDREETDFYPTPADVTEALMLFLRLPSSLRIWEPAAGQGHMVSVLESFGHEVRADDLFTHTKKDFLLSHNLDSDWIITNPPFKHSAAFIRHSLGMQPRGVAMLLKSQYWHAATRQGLFYQTKPRWVLPLSWRPDFLFGSKGSAPTMEVLWTVWTERHAGACEYLPLPRPNGTALLFAGLDGGGSA